MKKYLIILAMCVILQNNAMATNATSSVESTNKNFSLYNFDADLLNATKNCLPLKQNFIKNNPELGNATKSFFGGAEMKIDIDIAGWRDDNLCHFSVGQNIVGIMDMVSDCKVGQEQLDEIYVAMLDRSLSPVTQEFDTVYQYEEDGKMQKSITKQKMTDSLFNVTFAKIRGSYCTLTQREATQEEKQIFADTYNNFSDDFLSSLRDCQANEETKTMFVFSDTIKIVGWQEDKCLVEAKPFNLYLSAEHIASINSLDEIKGLRADTLVSQYEPEYDVNKMIFALDNCMRKEEYDSGNSSMTNENIEISKSILASYNQGICEVKLKNVLRIDGSEEDYSKICRVEIADVEALLFSYQDLLAQTRATSYSQGNSFSYKSETGNDETDDASDLLFRTLVELNLCD